MSNVTLWEDAAWKSPEKPRPRLNLGIAYHGAGNVEAALREYRNAALLSLSREGFEAEYGRALAYSNMAALLLHHGDYESAEMILNQTVRDFPYFLPALVNLSYLYAAQGKPQKVIELVDQSAPYFSLYRGLPGVAGLYNNKAVSLVIMGRCQEALAAWRLAGQLDPGIDVPTQCKEF